MLQKSTSPSHPVVCTSRIPQEIPYDKALTTRTNCIIGILFSSLLAVGCLGASAVVLSTQKQTQDNILQGTRAVSIPILAKELLPLAFSIIVACCTEALSYVHSTTLRWALIREERLEFNSNLRLFTASKTVWAAGKCANFISAVLLVICYTASGQLFVSELQSSSSARVIVNGIALVMLGIGLLGLSIINSLCLITSGSSILTWSPNPLTTALACLQGGILWYRPGRGMMSVHSANMPAQPLEAHPTQRPAREAYRTTVTVVKFLWFVFFLSCLLAAIICVITFTRNRLPSLNFFPQDGGTTYLNFGGPSWKPSVILLSAFLFGAVLQTTITMALHCMELLVNFARDEAAWRAAGTEKGATLTSSALGSAMSSWQWWALFIIKPLAQWLFGSAGISFLLQGSAEMRFNAEPLFVLAGVAFIISCLGEYLVRTRPTGPQPAAFGHLQTLVDLIDDWDIRSGEHLFWGQKVAQSETAYGRVGTSNSHSRVQPLAIGRIYSS